MNRLTQVFCVSDAFWPANFRADAPLRSPRRIQPLLQIANSVGVIDVKGVMVRDPSPFDDAVDTQSVMDAVELLAGDSKVSRIVLRIDSPGGSAAGIPQLADAVARARRRKSVIGFVDDCCCSAAFWVASQCDTLVAATPASLVGSIGVYILLLDFSELDTASGIKSFVVRSGEHKGLGADGRVSPAVLAEVQRIVDSTHAEFVQAVRSGRRIVGARLDEVTTGRAYVAREGRDLRLVDRFQSFEELLQDAAADVPGREIAAIRRRMNVVPSYGKQLAASDPHIYRRLMS